MLDPNSPVPLYLQLKELIKEQIKEGVYEAGKRLPSERELAQLHKISRMTARQALQSLTIDGFIATRTGKGTYVRESRIKQELRSLTSFTQDMHQRGLKPGSRVIACGVIQANDEVTAYLRLPPESSVGVLSRLRLANDEPIAWEVCHLNLAYCPGILECFDFSIHSLYAVLRDTYDVHLVEARQAIAARMPSPKEREMLALPQRTPVLALDRVTMNHQHQPIEYVNSVYRGDRYQLYTTLGSADLDVKGTIS